MTHQQVFYDFHTFCGTFSPSSAHNLNSKPCPRTALHTKHVCSISLTGRILSPSMLHGQVEDLEDMPGETPAPPPPPSSPSPLAPMVPVTVRSPGKGGTTMMATGGGIALSDDGQGQPIVELDDDLARKLREAVLKELRMPKYTREGGPPTITQFLKKLVAKYGQKTDTVGGPPAHRRCGP
jgi:hypothetical protein